VFDAEAITQMDSTGMAALGENIDELKKNGIGFAVARVKTRMRTLFDGAKLTNQIGDDRFYPTVKAAVAAVSAG
jgi:sulfate permease, SulP family